MKKKFHINSTMFLQDPYIVRIDHSPPEMFYGQYSIAEFRKTLKVAKTLIHGTWGYTTPDYEVLSSPEITSSNYFPPTFQLRSYWVFDDELDATQFRLTVGNDAIRVYMWPAGNKFTITEYIDD